MRQKAASPSLLIGVTTCLVHKRERPFPARAHSDQLLMRLPADFIQLQMRSLTGSIQQYALCLDLVQHATNRSFMNPCGYT